MNFSKDIRILLSHSLWSFLGTFISRGLMFVTWVLVANILGKTINGEVGVLRSTINLFISFVGTGFGLTLTKYIVKYQNKSLEQTNKIISASIFYSIILGLVLSLLYYYFSPLIATELLKAPHLLFTIRISVILLFLSISNSVFLGFLQGFEKFKEISIINIIYGISLFVFVFFGAKTMGINGTFIGFILAMFISLFISLLYAYKTFKIEKLQFTFDFKSELPVLYSFTIPAIFSGLTVVPFKWILDTLMVREENGYNEMGLFTALFLLHTLLIMTANTLNAPLITIMSKEKKDNAIEKLNLILPWSLAVLVSTPILLFPELLGLLFNQEYLQDKNFKWTIVLIIITTILVLYKNGMGRIMIVNNLMWFSFFSNLLWGLVLVSVFYFSPFKNAVSLSLAYAIAYFVNIILIIPVYVYKKIIPISIIASKESILIWILLSSLVYVSIIGIVMYLKIGLLLIYTALFIYLFYRLLNKKQT